MINNKDKKNQNKTVKVMDIVLQSDLSDEQASISKSEKFIQKEVKSKKNFKTSFLNWFKKNKEEKTEDNQLEEARNLSSQQAEKHIKIQTKEIKPTYQPSKPTYQSGKQEIINDFFKPRETKKEFKNLPVEKIIKPVEKREDDEKDFLKEEIGVVRETDPKWRKFRKYAFILLFFILIGGVTYIIVSVLPKADIKIVSKKIDWNFDETVFASKNATEISPEIKQIPATFFSETKNVNLAFEATGKKNVEKKAGGEIVVYNAFSSDSQNLVKGTRFESPDGKIFNLDKALTVPGAKISDGKIIPSNIKAKVTAEKAGQDYNIEAVDKFTIPGFKNSTKYEGFYAKSENPMSGGFVGEVPQPTEADIKSAREKTETALKETFNALMASQIPSSFKIIDSARKFSITKESVDKEADEDGKFSVFLEGGITIAAFKEEDILRLINLLAKQSLGENFEKKNHNFTYGAGQFDLENGKFSFIFNYKGTFWQPIDVEKFKSSILNKKELELKTAVFSMPGAEKANVSFWPFWVKTVPTNINRVKVIAE